MRLVLGREEHPVVLQLELPLRLLPAGRPSQGAHERATGWHWACCHHSDAAVVQLSLAYLTQTDVQPAVALPPRDRTKAPAELVRPHLFWSSPPPSFLRRRPLGSAAALALLLPSPSALPFDFAFDFALAWTAALRRANGTSSSLLSLSPLLLSLLSLPLPLDELDDPLPDDDEPESSLELSSLELSSLLDCFFAGRVRFTATADFFAAGSEDEGCAGRLMPPLGTGLAGGAPGFPAPAPPGAAAFAGACASPSGAASEAAGASAAADGSPGPPGATASARPSAAGFPKASPPLGAALGGFATSSRTVCAQGTAVAGLLCPH